jgi:hypothetical protein
MEVSNKKTELCGQELIETVVSLSGLPEMLIRTELNEIVDQSDRVAQELTLDQLRAAMIHYLEQINEDFVKESRSKHGESEQHLPS